jgi:hypothetical protein
MTVYRQHLDGWIMTFAVSHNFIEALSGWLDWLFFSNLLTPRRSQGFSIKLVLALMNFYDNKIYY